MTEELEQKAKDFIDRIGKESGGNWLDKYYLTDLLVMFVTEETKELQKGNENLRSIADYQQSSNMKRYFEIKELKEQIEKMKNRCNCVHGWYNTVGRADFGCNLNIDKCEGCKEWKLTDN